MKRIFTTLFVCISLLLAAQEAPFRKEIEAFKKSDSRQLPPENAIVFVGSSSFRMWKSLEEDFPNHTVINRGFGGSSLPHVIDYVDEIVIPYKPKQVVVYCGENDFMNDTVTSEIVVARFKQFFQLLRAQLPRAHIAFISMKPSPSRQHLMPKISAANRSIKDFLEGQRGTAYINIWDPMLDKNGAPRRELFLSDMLHMNAKGYAIWKKALEPHLR